MVLWENEFIGDASLKVAGINNCGTGDYSNLLNIVRYLPEVSLEPFEMICFNSPAFELTGGNPEGGEYSGPGIENGWFDPANAGIGTHEITYTYSDPEDCENFAIESILVDPCTGIHNETIDSDILIYPNPGKGIFSLRMESFDGKINLKIFNSMNEQVFEKNNIDMGKDLHYSFDLNHLNPGIYYLRISGNNIDHISKIIIQN